MINLLDFERRFDVLVPGAVIKVENENRKDKGIVSIDRSDIKSFLIQELKHLVEEIVPEEKQDDTHPSAAAAWNLCRQKMLNRIKEL